MKQIDSTDFQRQFGRYQDVAMKEPLIITRHDRPRLVLMSWEDYQALRREQKHLNEELDD